MTSKTGDPKDEGAATRQAEQASPEEHGMPAAGSPAPDVLADAVGRAGLGPDVVEALTRWLAKELVDDQFARLEQAGHRGERRIPLARVFVDLEVSVSPQPEPTGSSERPGFARTVLGMSPGSIAQEASRLDPTLRRSGAAGFVLIGGPGQGKSTLCQIVCQIHRGELLRHRANALPQAARDALGGLGELQEQEGLGRPAAPCFPVRIALADAAAWLSSEDREGRPAVASGEGIAAVVLLRYLSARLRAQAGILITPGDMGQVLAVCPWMLVLDGLDEVPVAADRGRVLAAARDLIARLSADGAEGLLLATTRPQGYLNELDGLGVPLQAVHLAPLSSLQALRYAERLLERLLVDQAERRRSVLDRLRIATEQQETARLMRSPLQVTIMTTLVDRIGRAPGERWSLFRDYYRVMYEREMERAAQGEVAESLRNHRPYIDRVHAHVGLLLQVESERAGGSEALMSAERLRQVIDAVLAEDEMERAQRDALARQIIWVARDRLVLLVEAQPGRFGFEVRSFQEFMAAWALSARGEAALEARITQIAGAASFRDVVLFLASKCFTELSDLREAFAERICPRLNEPPKGEALRSRLEGSVLALEILEEGSALSQPRYASRLMQVAARLLELSPSRLQLRLPGVRTVSTDPVLQDALSRALSGRDGESRRSAWIALSAALGDRAWAREMAEERWPEERAAQLAIVAAMARVSSSPDPWSADAHTDALRDFSAHFIRWLDARADSEARESWREAWLQAVAEREEDLRRRHGAQQEPPEGPSGATSGLEDPAVWDRLRLPLPRPESRSKSAPPPPSERGLVHITSIRLREVRPLQDLELKLGRAPEGKGQWVAIIGENATGKTTILRSLVLALMDLSDESRPAPLPQEAFTTRWRRNGAGTEEECSIAVMTASGDFKITIQSQQNAESFSHQQGPEGRPLIFGYGSRRGSALGGAAREVAYVPGDEIATLFTEGASLIHAETWLALRHAAKLTRPDGPEGLLFTAVLDALRELLPGVDKIEVRGMRVWVSGPAVGEVPLAALSDGYLATTGWVLDLIARWIDRAERRGEEVQPGFTQTMSGLVLIDEIDLYLHPRWQRSLIQDVRRVFPRMSFVITTHNPFTLLGAEPEEIWVLRRTEDRGVVAERGQESPALMSGSQIYSAYFGITSLFPDELGEKLRRYGFLAGSPVRTDEEEVEVHALLAELREHDVDPGWDIVPRESPPDFSEGEETGA